MVTQKKSSTRKTQTKASTQNRSAKKQPASAKQAKSTSSKKLSRSHNSRPQLPKIIYAQASPKSIGGTSLFDAGESVKADTAINFVSERHLIASSIARLREAGFQVLQATDSTINFSGSPKTFEEAFNAPIHIEQRPVIKEQAREDVADFLDCRNCDLPGLISVKGSAFDDVLEGIAIEEPQYYMAANAFPPSVDYWHLNVPADVSMGCNADIAHRGGITGKDVIVSMVDSGWFRHPFFTRRGYRSDDAVLAPGASNPFDDESGHGTGESANIFALAPDVHLKPVKMSFVNTTAAFNTAVGLNPDIITCSWGSSTQFGPLSAAQIAMANAISAALATGITVIFSAGNGHWGYPGQHPDVISAGGADISPDGSTRASDYASGFASNIYPGRNVPDLSGIVGMRPKAMNIMLPLQPGDRIDEINAGRTHPDGDETTKDDGWAAFSGTSAAAPQLAGAAALIKQVDPQIKPHALRNILMATANDVTQGHCHPVTGANPASVGSDLATGTGLVDAHRATLQARIQTYRAIAERRMFNSEHISERHYAKPTSIASVQFIEPLKQKRELQSNGNLLYSASATSTLANETNTINNHSQNQISTRDIGNVFNLQDLPALEKMITDGQLDPGDI